MKILAFVDSHGNMNVLKEVGQKAKKSDVDMVICAGDVSTFEQDIAKIIKGLDEIGVPVLIIPGNHESEKTLKEIASKSKNIVYLNKGMLRIKDYVFVGFSANGFAERDPEFDRWVKKVKKEFRKEDKIILVTHAPPYNTKLDNIMGSHCGNKDVRKFIETTNISLGISGHIHETAGREDSIKGRKIVNPGPKGMVIEV
ncbi:MAG: metallophosphoesterase [Candidatus Woesearchaeota archaeon]|nr:metallophosphoesterase [Candidatus Woesearchaeota archaeon]